jgi:hypothetical protein
MVATELSRRAIKKGGCDFVFGLGKQCMVRTRLGKFADPWSEETPLPPAALLTVGKEAAGGKLGWSDRWIAVGRVAHGVMPTTSPRKQAGFTGGAGLAAARELSTAAAAREAKVAGSKTAESKARSGSVDEKVSHEEEKLSASAEAASPDGPAAGSAANAGSPSAPKVAESKKSAGAGGRRHEQGEVMLPQTIKAQRIMDGFKILSMNMSDAHSGEVLWESGNWEGKDFEREVNAYVPKRILACKAVSREITFASLYVQASRAVGAAGASHILFSRTCTHAHTHVRNATQRRHRKYH